MGIVIYKQIWTQYVTNGSLTITQDFGLVDVSFALLSGAGTFQGMAVANGLASEPINLVIGQSISVGSGSNIFIDGLILTTTGTIQIIGR
jgi:hypothetical protein